MTPIALIRTADIWHVPVTITGQKLVDDGLTKAIFRTKSTAASRSRRRCWGWYLHLIRRFAGE